MPVPPLRPVDWGISLPAAHQNALTTQRGRMTNKLMGQKVANAPQDRMNALSDRAATVEQRDYTKSRRPQAEMEQDVGTLQKIIPGMDYNTYLGNLPTLQQRLPSLAGMLPTQEKIEADALKAGVAPEAYWEQQKAKLAGTGGTPEDTKYGPTKEGIDENGTPIVYRVNKETGEPQIIQGVGPKPGKRMVIRDPKTGNVIFETGAGPELKAKTEANIEKKLTDGSEQLTRMLAIYDTWKPEYSELGTRFAAAWTGTKAFLGQAVEEKDRQLLTNFKNWQQKSIENINLYIKELTGAQMSEKEADRLRLAQPDPGEKWYQGDDPITFKAKMDGVLKTTRASIARWNYYKSTGISEDNIMQMIDDGRAMSLDDMIAEMK